MLQNIILKIVVFFTRLTILPSLTKMYILLLTQLRLMDMAQIVLI